MFKLFTNKKFITFCLLGVCLIGATFRLWHITANNFFNYDEAVWMGRIRPITDVIFKFRPFNHSQFWESFNTLGSVALKTDKALWTFVLGCRAYFTLPQSWFFPRMVSAIFGILSFFMVYCFANKYFSQNVARWSVFIFALLPGQVYYSRLGIQESMVIFLFLTGVYFYLFRCRWWQQALFSGFFWGCVFLADYRMIIIPGLILFAEAYWGLVEKKGFQSRRYIWSMVVFGVIIFGVGSLNHGANTFVTFAWMFHQQNLSHGTFEIFNLLSYPYYLFRLESVFWGCLFFANIYFLIKRQWHMAFPFMFVILVMLIFSFPQEKGVRYVCFAMPFMVIAGALMVDQLMANRSRTVKILLGIFLLFMSIDHFKKDLAIAGAETAYEESVIAIKNTAGSNAKFISSQDVIQALFMDDPESAMPVYNNVNYFVQLYQHGYRYLIIEPQAYVSFTEDTKRFSPKLIGPLNFALTQLKPVWVYPHFSSIMLERFVLEHNENLTRSIQFLHDDQNNHYHCLRVYELKNFFGKL
ncbi:MAG: glycosyltransferase family 39 protein [Candidatus Omnitrophica bacterium]|nr:glycosyltransferase family 39 protein [Candidatus Omnitrophota bacterium]